MIVCTAPGCAARAALAVRTTRPSRDDIRSVVYYTPELAPKTASGYCYSHGLQLMRDLIDTLSEPEPDPTPPTEEN